MMEIEIGPHKTNSAPSASEPVGTPAASTSTPAPSRAQQLLNEMSRVSHHLDPETPSEWMIKRVQFFAYELQTFIGGSRLTPAEKLSTLNRFFFEEKKFRCITEKNVDALRLNRVLTSRIGMPLVLELLYACLAEGIGLNVEFVDLQPICFLKWRHDGQARYIDISRNGATLTNEELIETLHSRFRMTSIPPTCVLEECSIETFASDYVKSLKENFDVATDGETVLYLHNTLISYQPSNLQLLGERALLNRRLGHLKSALADLKRYFAFHDRSRASEELVKLHDELMELVEGRG